jgi:SAM-dependent MidA family methyltransferase
MNALMQVIREMIAAEGPISVERYMALALAHPVYGYYMSKVPFGARGDFVTAPEISQMFGELIGLWAAEVWSALGQPGPIRLIELGPGRGTLMADALRASKVAPHFRAALDVHLVEMSPVLREVQQKTLAASNVPLTWHASIEGLPRLVGLNTEGRLAFGLAPEPERAITLQAGEGAVLEICLAAQQMMQALAHRILTQGGALLVIDYGYEGARFGETLQAVKRHEFVDLLAEPGAADLTVHVDFSALRRAAETVGAKVYGPLGQGEWLQRLGILSRAEALKRHANAAQREAIDQALRRLTGCGPMTGRYAEMGLLFKVLCVTEPGLPAPPGFEEAKA